MVLKVVSDKYEGPKFCNYNIINLFDFFEKVIDDVDNAGEYKGYFKYEGDIYMIEVVEDESLFEVLINGVTVGEALTLGEMWEIVDPIISGGNDNE